MKNQVLFWKRSRQVRLLLGAAFVLYVVGENMTFMYFYPRNAVLFDTQPVDPHTLEDILKHWSSMNWVRSLVVATGCVCTGLAVHNSYTAVSYRKENVISKMLSLHQQKL